MLTANDTDRFGRGRGFEAGALGVVFALCLVGALGYTLRFASWVPWWDYWDLAEVIGGLRPLDPGWLLEPHQEHRIPLSKLGLVALAWAIPDVRAASLLNVLGCAAIAAIALRAARDLRGSLRLPDAVLPLLALHAGHYTTYLLGFQLQMVLSSLLVLGVFALLLGPTRARVAAAAALLVLLPLSGVNGIVAAPPLLLWLGFHLVSPERRSLVGLTLALAALAITLVLAVDSIRLVGASTRDGGDSLRTALQFVATGLGAPAGYRAGGVALALAAALALCAPALRQRLGGGESGRNEVLGIAAVLAGGLVLALVIGIGRSDHGPRAGIQHRYAVMSLLIAYSVHFGSVVAGRASTVARALQWAGLALVCLAVGAATADGIRSGRHYERTLARAERTIPVLPDDILGDELQTVLHGGSAATLAQRIGALRTAGLLPAAELPPADQIAGYRFGLVLRLIDENRLADAERQIDALAASGATREAERLRRQLAAAAHD
jgi:hypothetical protein